MCRDYVSLELTPHHRHKSKVTLMAGTCLQDTCGNFWTSCSNANLKSEQQMLGQQTLTTTLFLQQLEYQNYFGVLATKQRLFMSRQNHKAPTTLPLLCLISLGLISLVSLVSLISIGLIRVTYILNAWRLCVYLRSVGCLKMYVTFI